MTAGLSQLARRVHWGLSPRGSSGNGIEYWARSRASCRVLIMRPVTSRLLSLQPCSPFIKWLLRVRTEDANCKQPTETVCYTRRRNIKSTTNTKKLAESTCKAWFLASLRELGIGSRDLHSKKAAAGWHWSSGPAFRWIRCWLSALPHRLPTPAPYYDIWPCYSSIHSLVPMF